MHYNLAVAYNQPSVLSKHGSSDHHCHIFNMLYCVVYKKTFVGFEISNMSVLKVEGVMHNTHIAFKNIFESTNIVKCTSLSSVVSGL